MHVVVVVVLVVLVVVEDDGLLQHHVKKLASWACKSLIQIMWQTDIALQNFSVCSASCKVQKKITFFGNPIISCMWQ